MQRDEKNRQTRRKIMDSAVHEFALHGYEAASMNTICQQGGISKGIIYHYFESKEALYLACVQECFQSLSAVLQNEMMSSAGSASLKEESMCGDALLNLYFKIRLDFFHEHAGRRLRKDLTEEQATLLFHRLQNFLNAGMAALQNNETDIEKHKDGSRMMLDIFFNGILERK